jgi:hypothetical protein
MHRSEWPAWILIIAGVVLLLYQLDYIELTRADLFSYGFLILGFLLAVKAIQRPDRRGLFGAVFFINKFAIKKNITLRGFVRDDEFAVATLFLSLALANFVLFMVSRNRWVNFTWGVICAVTGAAVLSIHMGYYPQWYIYDMMEQYWPVALILLGLTIILRAFKRRSEDTPHHTTT